MTVDVDRSIREGRIVAAATDDQLPAPLDEERERLGLREWLCGWPFKEGAGPLAPYYLTGP